MRKMPDVGARRKKDLLSLTLFLKEMFAIKLPFELSFELLIRNEVCILSISSHSSALHLFLLLFWYKLGDSVLTAELPGYTKIKISMIIKNIRVALSLSRRLKGLSAKGLD